ncbi:MAG: NAD(P)H-dependent oxidoreductase [Methanomicrobiales archaeon]|nr:NAD(P)H-dependent oxidoreductase [Methanomicrobiales archaeon]
MKISVILAHPGKESLNHAIAGAVRAQLAADGHHVVFHDLYAEGFDPLLPSAEIPRDASLPPLVAVHCAEIRDADGIVIIHPNWWGQPPAILKGWVDRVLRPGIAYRFIGGDGGEGIPVGLLHATAALVFTTSNTPLEREMAVFGDPLEILWKQCIFSLCGVENFHRRNFSVVVTSTREVRTAWLAEVRMMVNEVFPRDYSS